MGYKPYQTKRVSKPHGYFRNTDEERAADINKMFANKKVDGILCVRDGYGCTRILHLINYDTIERNPKTLIGYSDVTALLNRIHKETGLICSCPVGSTIEDPYSKKTFKNILEKTTPTHSLTNAILEKTLTTNPEYERYLVYKGIANGQLSGGTLTLINALIGTPHEIDFTGKIVCVEDIEKAPYRIGRMLTQLIEGETLKKASGIVFSVCAGCDRPSKPNSFPPKEVLMDRIKPLGIPAVYGMSFGHIDQNVIFPIGAKATLNTTTVSIGAKGPWVK
jgi:muramoyltetrapeptide carboxypeptidase